MKRFPRAFVFALLTLFWAVCGRGSQTLNEREYVRTADKPISIDGDLSDWSGRPKAILGADSEEEASINADFYTAWTRSDLLLAIAVHDDRVIPKKDSFDVFLDLRKQAERGRFPYSKGVYHFRFQLLDLEGGLLFSQLGNGSRLSPEDARRVRSAVRLRPGVWSMEVGIPWSALNYEPETDTALNLSVAVQDADTPNDIAERRLGILDTDPINKPDTDPITFDSLVLSGSPLLSTDADIRIYETFTTAGPRLEVQVFERISPGAKQHSYKVQVGEKVEIGLGERLSYAGVFRVFSAEVPLPAQEVEKGAVALKVIDNGELIQVRDVLVPISRAYARINSLKEAAQRRSTSEREENALLGDLFWSLAEEVLYKMELAPTPVVPRGKQIRVRDNPNYYGAEIDTFCEWARRLSEGKHEPIDRTYVAWRRPRDGSIQMFKVRYPVGYDSQKSFPLELSVHPLLSDPSRTEWVTELQAISENVWPERMGDRIRIEMYGGGNHFDSFGDEEFEAVLQYLDQNVRYRKDAVVLSGASKGASDAFALALKHHEKITHLDLRAGSYVPDVFSRKVLPQERKLLLTLYDTANQISRLEGVRGRFAAGERDPPAIQAAKRICDAMTHLGIQVENETVIGAGHSLVIPPIKLDVVTNAALPEAVAVQNGSLRYGSIGPIAAQKLERFGEPWKLARVSTKPFSIVTQNVAELVVQKQLADQFASILVDGKMVHLQPGPDTSTVVLKKRSEGWFAHTTASVLSKTPSTFGPISDFARSAVTIVVGTLDQSATPFLRDRARRLVRLLTNPLYGGSPGMRVQVVDDSAANEPLMERGNVWILGSTSENALTAHYASSLAISVSGDTIASGETSLFKGRGLAMQLRPSPAREGQYLLFEIATTPECYLSEPRAVEFYDYAIVNPSAREPGPSVRGFFNEAWEFTNELCFRDK